VTSGDHEATVIVTAPVLGGTPNSYTVTVTATDTTGATRGGQTCTITGAAGSCTLTGLTDGDTYTATATATDPGGTSRSSPAPTPVVPAPPADTALLLRGPASADDGETFTETVTVTNNGPNTATGVATNVYLPPGLTVTGAPGAITDTGTLDWADPAPASGTSVTYPVIFEVGAGIDDSATIGAVTEGDGLDSNSANNAAITTVRLG
jgi:uncharacterized repeat protein (TIGR01451 family)